MARKPKSKPATKRAPSDDRSERARIIDAFMALLAEKPIEKIGLAEIARGAGVSLSDLRGAFGSTFAILAAFAVGFLIADLGILRARLDAVAQELDRLKKELRRRQDLPTASAPSR